MATAKEEFARRYFLCKLTGAEGVLRTSASSIEPDGRKVNAAVRALFAEEAARRLCDTHSAANPRYVHFVRKL